MIQYTSIPRSYTAIAECLSCLIFILTFHKRFARQKTLLLAAGFWVLQMCFMVLTGNVTLYLWVPCMAAASLLMMVQLYCCCAWCMVPEKKITVEDVNVGVTGMYLPGVNIHRTPFGGRAHEYFSEDPYLSGVSVEYEVKGLQEKGVIPYVKHFAFNDEEDSRIGNAVVAAYTVFPENCILGSGSGCSFYADIVHKCRIQE